LSKDEDLNGGGFCTNIDTDGDGISNFQDIDDDEFDGWLLLETEVKKAAPLTADEEEPVLIIPLIGIGRPINTINK
jgi:hypothetical protein